MSQPSATRRSPRPATGPTGEFTPRERHQARRLRTVLLVVAAFFVVELAGAFVADSYVLKADALHLLMDVAALATALVAMHIAVRRPTERFTFGLRRAEPVAAVLNAMLVLVATAVLVTEGVDDLRGQSAPRADVMLAVAIGALLVHGLSAWLIHGAIDTAHEILHDHESHEHAPPAHDHGHAHAEHAHHAHANHAHHARSHSHSLNLRGALLHLLGDALGSLAAIVAAVLIHLGFSARVDPIASFVVAAILVFGAIRLLKDAVLVLLEAAPPHLPVAAVRSVVGATAGVEEVHDLHVWSLGAGHDAITVHVHGRADVPDLARTVEREIRASFPVEYVAVQVEHGVDVCEAPGDVLAPRET